MIIESSDIFRENTVPENINMNSKCHNLTLQGFEKVYNSLPQSPFFALVHCLEFLDTLKHDVLEACAPGF